MIVCSQSVTQCSFCSVDIKYVNDWSQVWCFAAPCHSHGIGVNMKLRYGWRLQFYRPKANEWVRWDKFMHTVHLLVLFQVRNLDCIESLLLKFFNHYDDLWCLHRIPISWPKITPTRLCIGTKGLDQRTYQTSILHQPLFTSPIYRE